MAFARSLGPTVGSKQRKRVIIWRLGSNSKITTDSLNLVETLELELRKPANQKTRATMKEDLE
jgi:hypothetical protein